jgi:hypothetical protein
MGVLTKYDQLRPIYPPQSVVTYIYLHSVYRSKNVTDATMYILYMYINHVQKLCKCCMHVNNDNGNYYLKFQLTGLWIERRKL